VGLDQYLHREGPNAEDFITTWRKSNQIHAWFIDKCGLPPDFNTARSEPFGKSTLQMLVDDCKKALELPNMFKEVMPAMPGFFFGSTEHDEWYRMDLEDTIDKITEIIKNDPEDATYSYDCWW
jgi:hypothetical protein